MSRVKKLDDDNVLEFMDKEAIESTNTSDPISKTKLKVSIDQLQPYELNPRRQKNIKYDDLLASIEAVGLDHPPRITRRKPDDDKYSILEGGNTRLVILKELYEKYSTLAKAEQDAAAKQSLLDKALCFYEIECDFYPWSSDAVALAGHMRENELRGDTLFIEKALAVQKLHELYLEADRKRAEDAGETFKEKPLSTRKLADRISNEGGWTMDPTHISRFNYAANTLIQHIPEALWAGSGFPVVRKVSSLAKHYKTFWNATEPGKQSPDKVDLLFYDTLSEFDAEKINIDAFTQTLDIKLSALVDIDALSINTEIGALLAGSKVSLQYNPQAIADIANGNQANDDIPELPRNTVAQAQQAAKAAQEAKAPGNNITTTDQPARPQSAGTTTQDSDASNVVPVDHEAALPLDIPSLRYLIVDQVKLIESMVPGGNLSVVIADDDNPEHQLMLKYHIYYDVINHFDPDRSPQPQFMNEDDDTREMVFWQLHKMSRRYVTQENAFTTIFNMRYESYIDAFKKANKKNDLIELIFFFENRLFSYPDLARECQQLQTLQTQLMQAVELQG